MLSTVVCCNTRYLLRNNDNGWCNFHTGHRVYSIPSTYVHLHVERCDVIVCQCVAIWDLYDAMYSHTSQLEGMERPRTKGKDHSYVELEEDENVVEKYTKAMESITSAIQLDKLKQVCFQHSYIDVFDGGGGCCVLQWRVPVLQGSL